MRLANITYHDTSGRTETLTRYGFFVEHSTRSPSGTTPSSGSPSGSTCSRGAGRDGDARVFEYMIGNTDWSAVYGHNIVLIRDAAGRATAVPYDFDFSGLVDTEYARAAPELPIRHVRQRVVPRRLQTGHRLAARVLGVPGATWRDRALDQLVRAVERSPRRRASAISTASSKR